MDLDGPRYYHILYPLNPKVHDSARVAQHLGLSPFLTTTYSLPLSPGPVQMDFDSNADGRRWWPLA